jgi:hypothetical protein
LANVLGCFFEMLAQFVIPIASLKVVKPVLNLNRLCQCGTQGACKLFNLHARDGLRNAD